MNKTILFKFLLERLKMIMRLISFSNNKFFCKARKIILEISVKISSANDKYFNIEAIEYIKKTRTFWKISSHSAIIY